MRRGIGPSDRQGARGKDLSLLRKERKRGKKEPAMMRRRVKKGEHAIEKKDTEILSPYWREPKKAGVLP